MMILRGPTKVDLFFDRLHQPEPPWIINCDSLAQVNSHFWDWILWLASKEASGKWEKEATGEELQKMYQHLLAPLGCTKIPGSVEEGVGDFLVAIGNKKSLFRININAALEAEVMKGLRAMGYRV
jgi:hypothetical protein